MSEIPSWSNDEWAAYRARAAARNAAELEEIRPAVEAFLSRVDKEVESLGPDFVADFDRDRMFKVAKTWHKFAESRSHVASVLFEADGQYQVRKVGKAPDPHTKWD